MPLRLGHVGLAIFCLFIFQLTVVAQDSNSKAGDYLGNEIDDFQLKDVDGKEHSLSDYADSPFLVVVFLGQECPLVRLYAPRLNELEEKYRDAGVAWLGINSNQQDSLTELQHFVRTTKLEMPLLKDPGNRVADQFAAQRTPEVFVLNQDRVVCYHGRIDDQYTYGLQRPDADQDFLSQALDELIDGKPVSISETKTVGCIIGRVRKPNETGQVTFANQISRILQKSCVSCHRNGEIGPFELTDYDEVVGWAGMIQEVVNDRRMPPWHANPDHGLFRNDARLTDDEIELINQWVDDGAPLGDASELPEPQQFATGWQIGDPDVIIPMDKRPFQVPARGTVDYKYFVVDPGFEEDKWISAAECRPGNRAVIHHIIVGIEGEGDFGEGVHDRVNSDWIAAMAPGSPPMVLPDGYAKRVPAGTKLIFQMHYTPNGTPQEDISSVGLKFIDESEVTHQVATWKAIEGDFRIPAGHENYPVKARMRFKRDAELLTLFPHMHLRGKSFTYTAKYPDGEEEILLDVPHYDFNWQNSYELVEPKLIPRDTVIHCLAHFDNSENNLANPNPRKTVRWGDQTWQEMMIGYFNVAIKR